MPEYVQNEIDYVRAFSRQTTSDEESTTEAVQRNVILKALSAADRRIQSRLVGESRNITIFSKRTTFETEASEALYDLPSDVYAGDDIRLVEYSRDADVRHYVPLVRCFRSQIDNYPREYARNYCLEAGRLLLSPPPSVAGALVRLTYTKAIEELDIRRGQVDGTPGSSGDNYTTITLKSNAVLSTEDTAFDNNNYLCVVDVNGVVIRSNVQYSSYDSTTRTFTLAADQAVADGAIADGDYIVLGKNKTTHSQLPGICDDYRTMFAIRRVQMNVSNDDSLESYQELKDLETDIIKTLKNTFKGPIETPVRGAYA